MAPSASRMPTSNPWRASTLSTNHRVTRRVAQASVEMSVMTISSLSGVNSLPAMPVLRSTPTLLRTSMTGCMQW